MKKILYKKTDVKKMLQTSAGYKHEIIGETNVVYSVTLVSPIIDNYPWHSPKVSFHKKLSSAIKVITKSDISEDFYFFAVIESIPLEETFFDQTSPTQYWFVCNETRKQNIFLPCPPPFFLKGKKAYFVFDSFIIS